MRKILQGVAAAALMIAPFAAAEAATATNSVDTSYGDPQPREDKGFPWGLLGLLGLAGLLGRKRRDDSRPHH